MSISARQKGIVALVYLSFQFACMGLFARYLSTSFTVLQQVYLRVVAAGLLALFLFRGRIHYTKLRQINKREWLVIVFRAIMNYLIAVALFSAAVLHAKIGTVSFINALPFVAIFGVVFFKEKLGVSKVATILLSLLGVLLVATRNTHNFFDWGYGEVLAVIGAAGFALSFVSRRWHSTLLNDYEITTLMFGLAFISLVAVSLLFGQGLPTHGWSLPTLLAVIVAGLLNAVGLLLVNYAFTYVDNILAGNLLMLEIAFGLLLGFVFYHELYSFREVMGGVMIVVAAILMNYLTVSQKGKRKVSPIPGEEAI